MSSKKQPTLPAVYLDEDENKSMTKDPFGWSTFLSGLDGSSITMVGLYIDLALAFGEGIVGLASNSHALIADSAHSFGDSLTDVVTLLCLAYSKKLANIQYPHGYGKYETLGSVLVSCTITIGAIAAAKSCMYSMLFNTKIKQLNANAAWCAFASIIVKEWLYQKTAEIAHKETSSILLSNAWHHRIDAMTSIMSLVAILVSSYTQSSWAYLGLVDPICGFVVSLFLIRMGLMMGAETLPELLDRAEDQDAIDVLSLKHRARYIVECYSDSSECRADVRVGDVAVLRSGRNRIVKMQLLLQGWMMSAELISVQEEIRRRLILDPFKTIRFVIHTQ